MSNLTDKEREARSISSKQLPFAPKSERGDFQLFMEESGANCVITEALRSLHEEVQKPDDPIAWLTNYFRALAPKRDTEVKEVKTILREKLMALETTILLLKEEEQAKIAQLNKLFKCSASSDGNSLPDPAEYHSEGKEQLRIDTKWRIAPDPFLRATCSDEALKKRREDKMAELFPEDGLYDYNYYGQDLLEQEFGGEFGDEDWFRVHSTFKDTEFPKKDSKTVQLPPSARALDTAEETAGELEVAEEIHPDQIPDNYWLPGFTLNPFRCQDESSSLEKADMSLCGENPDECYKSSFRGCKYMRRPHRSQIIFENDYNVWRTDWVDPIENNEEEEVTTEMNEPLRPRKSTISEVLLAPPNTTTSGDVLDDNVYDNSVRKFSKMRF